MEQNIKTENVIRKIAITGPESTGKSTLAAALSNYFNTVFVPEYAREYIAAINRPYNYKDILEISKGQVNLEKQYLKTTGDLLICDTELTVTKIWCEFKFNKYHEWIIENQSKQNYDIYLLCNIDMPWKSDPMREHPNKRKELFDLYKSELKRNKFNFEIISGPVDIRLNKAIGIIQTLLTEI